LGVAASVFGAIEIVEAHQFAAIADPDFPLRAGIFHHATRTGLSAGRALTTCSHSPPKPRFTSHGGHWVWNRRIQNGDEFITAGAANRSDIGITQAS